VPRASDIVPFTLTNDFSRREPERAPQSDEGLVAQLARGQHEALGPLYARYAGLVYHISAQSLGRATAEEVVQEVFLTVWRNAASFDPELGTFRPWLLRLTHWRILNELRRQGRQPREQTDGPLQLVPDEAPGPEEHASQTDDGRILQAALDALPPKQRQAVAMAFLQDMTHEQVATALDVPLGTAKTRIRSGLAMLRANLAPLAASLLAIGIVATGLRYLQIQREYDRDERAVALVTTSDLTPLRLVPASSDIPPEAHANYRARPGNNLAVLTAEHLPAGAQYEAWIRHGNQWTSLGTVTTDAAGTARLIAENPTLASPPDSIEIRAGDQVVLAWPSP
jgi:RNA polymerase sigma-70 factor (ECF subfamily)